MEFYADFFYRRKKDVIEEISEEVIALLEEYVFTISNNADEVKNQIIIDQINMLLSNKLSEKESMLKQLKRKEMPKWSNALKILDEEYGLVDYLSRGYTNMNYEQHQEYLANMNPEVLKDDIDATPGSDEYYSQFTVEDYRMLLDYVQILFYNEHIDDIENDYNSLIDSITIYGMMNAKSQTNIFRQGFVLLMTAFDATIADITRMILKEDFFDFLNKTDCKAKSKNYKLSDIIAENNFDEFKEKVIDEIMRENYVAGLLKLLYQYNKTYFEVDGEDKYTVLCEIVARRNVHVHKRGIVDEKYFSDSQGNIYNFSTGDYANISSNYFHNAYKLLLDIVQKFK